MFGQVHFHVTADREEIEAPIQLYFDGLIRLTRRPEPEIVVSRARCLMLAEALIIRRTSSRLRGMGNCLALGRSRMANSE